jgi:D-hydroxyproline dehydrogenase subunit beta
MAARSAPTSFDVAVVGAGIIGLATALAAVRRRLRVVVIDRDAQANGASVRNFGFVTVSGQDRELMWARARRTREVWEEVATAARIPVVHRGMWLLVRRPEAVAVLEQFLRTDMAEGCRLLSATEARRRGPGICGTAVSAVLESTIELRVESRNALPAIAAWLEAEHGVTFMRSTTAQAIDPPWLQTSRGRISAQRIAVCPGDDFNGLCAEWLSHYPLTRCKLQMLRLADPGVRLPATLLSDLGLARYHGYAALPAAGALAQRLAVEQPEHLKHGVHLIVVQSADGTLVVGDSHHYSPTPDPFADTRVDELILDEFRAALGFEPPSVLERWTGTYASGTDQPVLLGYPASEVGVAIVTSGAGASTGFAIGEELVAGLLDSGVSA